MKPNSPKKDDYKNETNVLFLEQINYWAMKPNSFKRRSKMLKQH